MKEKNLLITALICSIIGIFIILSVQHIPILNQDSEITNITSITKESIGENVKIAGTLTRLTQTEELAIMNIEDNTGKITAIFFTKDELDLIEGQTIEIEGEIIEYQGKLEIEISNIIGR